MGGVAKAVGNVVESAVDVVKDTGKAAGKVIQEIGDIAEDAVEVVKDAGSWIDDSIIQPAKDDPLKTAVMIAAVAYGGPAAASYFQTSAAVGSAIAAGASSAANTLASGGDIDDALKNGVVSAGAVYAGGQIGSEVAAETGSRAAGNIAKSASTGGIGAGLAGGDAAQGFLTGAITGGVGEAVEGASAAVKDATGTGGPTINLYDTKAPTTTGLEFNADGGSQFGLDVTPQAFGIAQPQSSAVTPLSFSDYTQYANELGIGGPKTEFGIDFSKTGETGITSGSSGFGIDVGQNPEPAFDTVEPPPAEVSTTGSTESDFEKTSKSLAKKYLTGELLGTGDSSSMYGDYDPYQFKNRQTDMGEDLTGTTNVALKQVGMDESELRKFANDAGKTTLIPFKNQKPQAPIPAGYKEVAVIGKAEGGLIDKPSTTMVKYSKKPLVAPRKQVQKPKKNKIAGKGLAVKKT
jgi:hypothetical protein